MSVKFANNAFGTLNAGISNSATSITLSSGQGARFPTLASGEYFYATLIDTSNNLEVVKCTARSTDVLTVTRAQESTTAQAFAIGDRIELRVTAGGLTDAANPYDKDTSSTGSFALPSGTTAQQPTAADSEGHIRYDTDDSVVYYSDGSNWLKVSSIVPILSSVTGTIFTSSVATLTLAGTGFLSSNLVVNFTQSSDSIDEDVTVTPTSDTAATVAVPAAVYNNVTAGNVVSVSVTNSDGASSAAVSKTALALPSGGTITTSGNFRIHTFTSTGTFINTIASLSTEYLIVAGGGGGGHNHGGGAGAGGMRTGTTTVTSTGSFTATVGGGGAAGASTGGRGSTGGTSSFNSISSTGGGGGGGRITTGSTNSGGGGGSGGGGAGTNPTTAGAGTAGQGNNGGAGSSDATAGHGGGGGGAGAAGAAASGFNNSGTSGAGGNGLASSITGSSVTYAGGGSGGTWGNAAARGAGGSGGGGLGGIGGGGAGPTAGAANTGGGGGGGADGNASGLAGGSGIVIVRYDLTAI